MKNLFRDQCEACKREKPCCARVYLLDQGGGNARHAILCRDCRAANNGRFRLAEQHLSEHERRARQQAWEVTRAG